VIAPATLHRPSSAPHAASAPAHGPRTPRLGGVVLMGYAVLLVWSAMDAYTLGPLPLEWLTQLGAVGLVVCVGFSHRLYVMPGLRPLVWLLLWGAGVSLVNALSFDYTVLMPQLSTLPYGMFVLLRLFLLVAFAATAMLVYWLLVHGYQERMVKLTVRIGAWVAAFALYVYVAQLVGLPEPPRNRMGTTGAEQATVFQYAFHRAMGSFREPSHLAEWLTVPLFFSLAGRRFLNTRSILMASAILLSGSLTGILGAGLAFLLALLLSNPFKLNNFRVLVRLSLAGVLALVMFQAFVTDYGGNSGADLFSVVEDRVRPILFEGGIKSTNRYYVYDYAAQSPAPFFGYGLGNSNLRLSDFLDEPIVSSFLSLYLNTLYSLGYPGLILLLVLLLAPPIRFLRAFRGSDSTYHVLLLAMYLCYLIVFAVHLEALSFMFAVVLAFVAYEAHEGRREEMPGAAA
jgi:hypothetical protein